MSPTVDSSREIEMPDSRVTIETLSSEDFNLDIIPPIDEKKPKFTASLAKIPLVAWVVVVHLLFDKLAFSGVQAILPIYLTSHLGFSEDISRVLYHVVAAICYLAPIAGAIAADNKFGRLNTIIVSAIVSCIGYTLVTTFAFVPLYRTLFLISIVIVSIGTGGAKACLSAFAGDQICPDNCLGKGGSSFSLMDETTIDHYYSLVYFAVNLGGLVGQLTTPALRSAHYKLWPPGMKQSDFGYGLAFGLMALCFCISFPIFLSFKRRYVKSRPEPVLTQALRYYLHNMRTKFSRNNEAKVVENDFNGMLQGQSICSIVEPTFVLDHRCVLRVSSLFIPIPIFWALYEQQGSTWVFQARQMNGQLPGGLQIEPEQMLTLNVVTCLLTIPVMNTIVYPLFEKFGMLKRLTTRIIIGYLVASASFLCGMGVQFGIDYNLYGSLPGSDEASNLLVMNRMPNFAIKIEIEYSTANYTLAHDVIQPLQTRLYDKLDPNEHYKFTARVMENMNELDSKPVLIKEMQSVDVKLQPGGRSNLMVQMIGYQLNIDQAIVNRTSINSSSTQVRLSPMPTMMIGLCSIVAIRQQNSSQPSYVFLTDEFQSALPGRYRFEAIPSGCTRYPIDTEKEIEFNPLLVASIEFINSSFLVGQEGIAIPENILTPQLVELVQGRLVHMTVQIPQILLMTFAEILICISSVSLAYSAAPERMRTILQALNQSTVFAGNLVIILFGLIIPQLNLPSRAYESLFYASLASVCSVITCFLVKRYNKQVELTIQVDG